MNDVPKPRRTEHYKNAYPPGTRVELTADMFEENIPAGTKGAVIAIDDIGTLPVNGLALEPSSPCIHPQETETFWRLPQVEQKAPPSARFPSCVQKATISPFDLPAEGRLLWRPLRGCLGDAGQRLDGKHPEKHRGVAAVCVGRQYGIGVLELNGKIHPLPVHKMGHHLPAGSFIAVGRDHV